MNETLNALELAQISFCVYGTCLGALRLSYATELPIDSLLIGFIYILGFVSQFALDCYLGTLLYYEASLVPEGIFQSNCLNLENQRLKKDIIFLLQNTQRIPQFNSYNLYDLNMFYFGKVIKLAFSLYTVLSSLRFK